MLGGLGRLVPTRIRNSYAAKFGLALVAVILLVGIVGGVVHAHTTDVVRADTEEELATTASIEADRIDNWMRKTRVQQATQAQSEAFSTGERQEVAARLSAIVEQDRTVRGAYHVNASSGNVFAKRGDGSLAADGQLTGSVHDRVRQLQNDSTTVDRTPVFRPGGDGDPAFLFVSDIPNSMPFERNRVLVTVVDAAAFSDVMLQERDGSTAAVVNERGTVVLSRSESLLLTEASVRPGERAAASGFYTAANGDGAEQAVGYAAVESAGWTLTARTPTDEAFALLTDLSRGILAMIAVAAAGALLIGLTIGRNTVRSVRHLSAKATALERGDLDTELETDRTDEFGTLYAAFGSMRDSLRDQIRTAEAAKEEAERRREASEERAAHLEATADEYGDVMRACADGDLSRRLPPDEGSEAMAAVAHEFNQMMNELEATIADVKRFADDVAASSERVTASADDVSRSSEQVTESIQSISAGADRQNEQFQAVSAEMDELAASVQQVAAAADDVAAVAERTAETGREGRESAEAALDEMDAVATASREAVAAIEELRAEMAEIQAVVDLISEMADQTDMVALNASVEAARSASSDREGFGVVADEVRELADDTKEAAAEIEERIAAVRDQTERTADEVRSARDDVTRSAESVRNLADAFDDVAEYATETNSGVQEIRTATSEQATSTEEVVSMVSEAAAISEETTAEAETVAAAAEEQTATLGEVADDASGLASQAKRLHAALDRFEADLDAADPIDASAVR